MLRKILLCIGVLFAAFFLFGTVCPMVSTKLFWVRMFDFPRVQMAGLGLVTLPFLFARGHRKWSTTLAALVIAGIGWQAYRIFPFTSLASTEVQSHDAADTSAPRVRLLTCNVFQENKETHLLLAQIEKEQPDIVLLLEVNERWMKALQGLHVEYPHRISEPLDNTWGIALFSKFRLDAKDVHYYASPDRPAVRAVMTLPSGQEMLFLGLHPAPPGYKEPDGERISSAPRDHTLVQAAKEAVKFDGPVLVAGDFNDSAWSRMTRKFQRISQLLDPRVGRGFFNTFDANHWLLRYPIDHVFTSTHWRVSDIRRLPHVASDHFPMFGEFVLVGAGKGGS